MEPSQEEVNKSPEVVATLAANATDKAAPRRSSRTRPVSVEVVPVQAAPRKSVKKKSSKSIGAAANGKRAECAITGSANKAPVVDLAPTLEKPAKRAIMRLTAKQLDEAYAAKKLGTRPSWLKDARDRLVSVLLDTPTASCDDDVEIWIVLTKVGSTRLRAATRSQSQLKIHPRHGPSALWANLRH